jgi:hypothetical protein
MANNVVGKVCFCTMAGELHYVKEDPLSQRLPGLGLSEAPSVDPLEHYENSYHLLVVPS